MWIKICGNTNLADVLIADALGANAVGFVFAPSPRRVSQEQVKEILSKHPLKIEKIGVFVDSDFEEIEQTIKFCTLTGVQLHHQCKPELPAQLRNQFGSALRILRVVHFSDSAADELERTARDPNIDGVLIDSRTATTVGGTGLPFDWKEAQKKLFTPGRNTKLIAAGGLNPANLSSALSILKPWGVDVVTGVEAYPGKKDGEKLAQFILLARFYEKTRAE